MAFVLEKYCLSELEISSAQSVTQPRRKVSLLERTRAPRIGVVMAVRQTWKAVQSSKDSEAA